MTVGRSVLWALALTGASTPVASAGSYFLVVDRVVLDTGDPKFMQPLALVHPVGYTGSGGPITVKVCVDAGSEQLIAPLQVALNLWNALIATTGNCIDCLLAEEPPPPFTLDPSAFTALVHELGHCGFGLDHINFIENVRPATFLQTGTCDIDTNNLCGRQTSFTASGNATEINAGVPASVRGNGDDVHLNKCPVDSGDPLEGNQIWSCIRSRGGEGTCPDPPTCCPEPPRKIPWDIHDVAWFRMADNNPFVVDSTVIDRNSYSRNFNDLPGTSMYAASGNRGVGEALGFPQTQSVMYSGVSRRTRYWGLAADDVNMVKMGMTGVDRDAGTADDYTVNLVYEPNCAQAQIRVSLDSELLDADVPAACLAEVALSFPQPGATKFHWSLRTANDVVYPPSFQWLILVLNSAFPWDFSVPLFRDGFEGGDLSGWSSACPPACDGVQPVPSDPA